MNRPRLRIVCGDHDRVIAVVVDTDEGPAYGSRPVLRTTDEAIGDEVDPSLYRAIRRAVRAHDALEYLLLDPSEDPIQNAHPHQLWRRGPLPAYCPRCHRSRGDLEVRDC